MSSYDHDVYIQYWGCCINKHYAYNANCADCISELNLYKARKVLNIEEISILARKHQERCQELIQALRTPPEDSYESRHERDDKIMASTRYIERLNEQLVKLAKIRM